MARVVSIPFSQLAGVALEMTAQAKVAADDNTLAFVQATRTFLRGIASGELTVTAADPVLEQPPGFDGIAPPAGATPVAAGTAANGGDGVVSEATSGAPQP